MLVCAEEIAGVVSGQFSTRDNSLQHVIVSFELHVDRHQFEITIEPKPADLLQRYVRTDPTAFIARPVPFYVPPLARNGLNLFQQSGLRMNVKYPSKEFLGQHGSNAA